ncbi:MAG: ATP-binding cassette domain-containing protein [Desulfobacterales bacterium]|nr:ATP-binding cassette domain-containing protein [Desulfobacterales bacterium]
MALEARIIKKMPGFTIDVAFGCDTGRLLAMVGPSGAGKTTIIRILAGLERPDFARITCNGRVWADTDQKIWLPARKRQLGYVFQEFTLFPHLNVAGNVAFGARDSRRVDELLRLFGIRHLRDRRVQKISGGERQRVALAQALAREPEVLLLDEPFSALDPLTRGKLRQDMLAYKSRFRLPIIHVTHDLQEAALLADQLLPMTEGRIAPAWLEKCLALGHCDAELEKRIIGAVSPGSWPARPPEESLQPPGLATACETG